MKKKSLFHEEENRKISTVSHERKHKSICGFIKRNYHRNKSHPETHHRWLANQFNIERKNTFKQPASHCMAVVKLCIKIYIGQFWVKLSFVLEFRVLTVEI